MHGLIYEASGVQVQLKRAAIVWGHKMLPQKPPQGATTYRPMPGFFELCCAIPAKDKRKKLSMDCFQVTPEGFWYNHEVRPPGHRIPASFGTGL